MNIVLICPPQIGLTKGYLPPIGIGYIASSLEKIGCKVRIIDAYPEKFDKRVLTKYIFSDIINLKCLIERVCK